MGTYYGFSHYVESKTARAMSANARSRERNRKIRKFTAWAALAAVAMLYMYASDMDLQDLRETGKIHQAK